MLCVAGGLRAAHAGPLPKTGKTQDKAAPQEEVNVLMFGVVQFSESLNYAYETTAAKMAKISKMLKSHEGTLQTLGKQTEQAAEVEKQMKDVIRLLQVRKSEKICKQLTSLLCAFTREITAEKSSQTTKLNPQQAGASLISEGHAAPVSL